MALTTNVPRATLQTTSYMQNGMSTDIEGTLFPLQTGVPIQNNYMFKVIPASLSATCVSSANAWVEGGQPLNQKNTGTAPNIISTAFNSLSTGTSGTLNNIVGVLLDCERCVSFTLSDAQGGHAQIVTATGFDYLGNPVETSLTLPLPGEDPQLYFVFPTPMSIVTSVVFPEDFSGGGGGITCTIGNSNNIGLPYYLSNQQFVQSCIWAGTPIVNTSITPGYNWRTGGADLSYTGPPRGYVSTPTDTNGTSLLTCLYYVSGSDSELNAEMNNANQSSLKVAQVKEITSGSITTNILPYLTKYDLTGVVYPADTKFINAYAKLLS